MSHSTKVLIHDERQDAPEFLFEMVAIHGYKAGYAKDASEIVDMLSNARYEVVLTNGRYRELDSDRKRLLKSSSVFIISIKDSHKQTENVDLEADLYLSRPFLISELWKALEYSVKH
ncbi:MAG: hypothetical protein ACLP9S_06630 [Syntrophales bacterium]|jgi:DNA-binding response OmpR family regulator